MSYLAEAPSSGAREEFYAEDEHKLGYVANYSRVMSHRPRVYRAWQELNAAVKATMDPVRYEVATIAAARERHSDYCSLAHGAVLSQLLDVDTTIEVATGADPDPLRAAIATLAARVAAEPAAITEADLAELRGLGLDDVDLLDVILAASARCFFSSVLAATGTEPDPAYEQLPAALRIALAGESGERGV